MHIYVYICIYMYMYVMYVDNLHTCSCIHFYKRDILIYRIKAEHKPELQMIFSDERKIYIYSYI
jgi:hypothetical protein